MIIVFRGGRPSSGHEARPVFVTAMPRVRRRRGGRPPCPDVHFFRWALVLVLVSNSLKMLCLLCRFCMKKTFLYFRVLLWKK